MPVTFLSVQAQTRKTSAPAADTGCGRGMMLRTWSADSWQVAVTHDETKWPHDREAEETCAVCFLSNSYSVICSDDSEHGLTVCEESVVIDGQMFRRAVLANTDQTRRTNRREPESARRRPSASDPAELACGPSGQTPQLHRQLRQVRRCPYVHLRT